MRIQLPNTRPAIVFQGTKSMMSRAHIEKRIAAERRIVSDTTQDLSNRLRALGFRDPGVLPIGIPDGGGPHITIAFQNEEEKNKITTLVQGLAEQQRRGGIQLPAHYPPEEVKVLNEELLTEWQAHPFRDFDADDAQIALNCRYNGIEIALMDLPKGLAGIKLDDN